ncbi:MOSC domain-containing protein [Meiothermus sp.]|uniref:MOSC domain-containing protein n=1 Tax=Meiothermus sp. TaxID=1955249 RepID=UPI0021DE367B|nr:MOSC domain-containing protein [Meiothermus sp.]GIW25105.1 MAG: molybdenum cofactor biosynthesis protein [Meiothermus sp.]
MPKVLSLHAGQGSTLPKPAIAQARLVEGQGLEGDRHFGKHPDRAVLVAGRSSYERAALAGIQLPLGALGENILLDFDPHLLGPGAQLEVGETLLELSGVCTVCNSLSVFDLRLPKVLLGRRGLYARVLRGGVVRLGDAVRVRTPQTT